MLYELGFTDVHREMIHDDLVRAEERARITKLINDKICFGHIETGSCDHQLCWGLVALLRKIEQENK
jgi:hypothetical protein